MISVSYLLHPVCISEGWHLCSLLFNILIVWSLVVFNRGVNLQNGWEPGKVEGWAYSLLAICPIIGSGLIFIFFLKKGFFFLLGDFVLPCPELEKLLSPYSLICGLPVSLWPCGNSVWFGIMKTALTFTIPITTTLHQLFPSLNRVSHLFPVHTKLTKVVKKGLSDGLIDNMSFEKDIPEADIQGKT